MLGCDIYVTTRQLTVAPLSEERERLLELVWKLHTDGMENKEISNDLNSNKIRPRRTKTFTGKLGWNFLKKYRAKRKNQEELDGRIENIPAITSYLTGNPMNILTSSAQKKVFSL